MAKDPDETPVVVPINAELARMMAYTQTDEFKAAIAKADAEIAAGKKIVADDAFFERFKARLHKALSKAE